MTPETRHARSGDEWHLFALRRRAGPDEAHLCVFCGSAIGRRAVYADAARAMATALLDRGLGLVYGGGSVGLMGTLADAVLAGGGEVIGVLPERPRPEASSPTTGSPSSTWSPRCTSARR